ncbi:MAG TPA: extracellular solute-binding protein [Bacillota bacterium]|nr:extracellular solute-binding protein [Bacillota bacterium]
MLTRRQLLQRGAYSVAAFGLVAAGCGSAAAPAASGGSSSAGTASAAASSSAALSGKLTVYAALTAANGKALQDAFQQVEPGVQVSILTSGSGALLSRVEAERKAGGVNADVLMLADPTAVAGLDSEGVLSHTLPSAASSLPDSMRGPAWFAPFSFNNVILAHKGMTQPEPKDWSDLTQDAYKGKIEIGNPGYSGTTLAMVGALSAKLGWSYFTSLQKQGATVVQSTNTVGTDCASGAKLVGISLDSVGTPLVEQGSPVDMIWPSSGTINVPAPTALIKGKESDLTQAFLAWLLTAPAQSVFSKSGLATGTPTHTQLPVDWPSLVTGRDNIIKQFNQIFGQ